jgi:hypothetical protein
MTSLTIPEFITQVNTGQAITSDFRSHVDEKFWNKALSHMFHSMCVGKTGCAALSRNEAIQLSHLQEMEDNNDPKDSCYDRPCICTYCRSGTGAEHEQRNWNQAGS